MMIAAKRCGRRRAWLAGMCGSMATCRALCWALCWVLCWAVTIEAAPPEEGETLVQSLRSPAALLRMGADQKEALKIADGVYLAIGFANTAMVTTDEGNVIIDTSLVVHAPRHKRLLEAVSQAPIRYIILTHGHADHRGGVRLWKQPDTKVVAHRNYEEFIAYQSRLRGFFRRRNAAQFAPLRQWFSGRGVADAPIPMEATLLVGDRYDFTLGGVRFEVHHTPGETYDHISVWLPDKKIAFVGDNYYASFPNLYTLRGTKPRWALDYVHSLDKVLAWKPEIVVPAHGMPIRGAENVQKRLTRYRDAIQYVHDAVVQGMNDGKDVYTLMREIRLPEELQVGQLYGRLTWSIRGIYEGYAGWFDGNVANMYAEPVDAVYADLVQLAGGVDPVARRAREKLEQGHPVQALRLTDVALKADPRHEASLRVRLDALRALQQQATNVLEMSWLSAAVNETKKALANGETSPAAR